MTWRPTRTGFRLGAMRERIDLQTPTSTLDDAGQPIRSWATTYSQEPAQRVPLRGKESLRGGQVQADVDEIFVIHYRDSITTQMRVVHNTRNYGIVYAEPVEGGNRFLLLAVKANV